jgi:hypothetical protein
MPARAAAAALALQLFLIVPAAAQSASDAEAHIFSALTSSADPRVLADNVRLGPALRGQLGEADRGKVYEALVERISGRFFRVDVAPAADAGAYAALAGGNPADPLIVVEAGEVALLLQYAPRERHVTFVEQLRGPAVELAPAAPKSEPVVQVPLPTEPPPPPPAPVAAPPPPPAPVIVEKPKPKPAPPRAAEKPIAAPVQKPAVAEKPKPRGECVIKPVMTEDDLYNCAGPTPPASYEPLPPPVSAPKPAPRAAEPPRKPSECVIKPVMTDDELRACGARR